MRMKSQRLHLVFPFFFFFGCMRITLLGDIMYYLCIIHTLFMHYSRDPQPLYSEKKN